MRPTDYSPTERRPIASRDWMVFQALAARLARRRVSPNAISVFGMFAAMLGGGALALTTLEPELEFVSWIAAALLIQIRLLANMLDGMVAIESKRASTMGELYNEVPDRVSDAAVLIGLGYAAGGDAILGYGAAAVAIFTAYVRAMGKVVSDRQEFCGPMAKPQRMFVVTVAALYAGLAPASVQPSWGLARIALVLIIIGGLVTALRRLVRVAKCLKVDVTKRRSEE